MKKILYQIIIANKEGVFGWREYIGVSRSDAIAEAERRIKGQDGYKIIHVFELGEDIYN